MSEYFGKDPETWNVGLSYDDHVDGDGSGRPGVGLFGRAVQVWASMQDGEVSVRDASKAFNCDDQMIVEAVAQHYWMFLSGPEDDFTKLMIEHEGE